MAGPELAAPPNLELHAGARAGLLSSLYLNQYACSMPPLGAKTVANTSSTVGNMGNEIFMIGKGGSAALLYHSPTSLILTMTKNLLHGETRTTLNHSLKLTSVIILMPTY